MNAWLWAAEGVMVIGFAASLWVVTRGALVERAIGTELATTTTIVALLLLTEGFGRSTYDDLALTLAALSLAGSLVFLRFIERWL